MSYLAMGLQLASGVMGAAGALRRGREEQFNYQEQARVSQYRAQVARNNAVLAEQNRERALASGYVDAMDLDLELGQTLGQQRAGMGASGFAIESPSFRLVQSATHAFGRRDAETTVNNAQVEGRNWRQAAQDATDEGRLLDRSAVVARDAGDRAWRNSWASAAGSLVGGAAAVAPEIARRFATPAIAERDLRPMRRPVLQQFSPRRRPA